MILEEVSLDVRLLLLAVPVVFLIVIYYDNKRIDHNFGLYCLLYYGYRFNPKVINSHEELNSGVIKGYCLRKLRDNLIEGLSSEDDERFWDIIATITKSIL